METSPIKVRRKSILFHIPIILVGLTILFILFSAAFPEVISPYSYKKQHPRDALHPPSSMYLLGTDQFGRDIFSRLIHGTRVVVLVGLGSVALAALVGVPLGMVAGYYGGWLDAIIMRILDAVLAFPVIILGLLIIASIGASTINLILTIAFAFVPRFARLTRGSVMDLKQREYVLASEVAGAQDTRLLFLVMLPNILGPVVVQSTLGIAIDILMEATFSYLGLGIQPPTPSWGNMLQHAQNYLFQAPWFVLATGFTIFLAVLVFNLAGDWLRERPDPRLRSQ